MHTPFSARSEKYALLFTERADLKRAILLPSAFLLPSASPSNILHLI